MASSAKLSPLQIDFLRVWFGRSPDFFLTGGGALVGYYGCPRTTSDLDLFTLSAPAFSSVASLLHDCTHELGASAISLVASPHFRRYRLERGNETTLIDFVEELAPQIEAEKRNVDGVLLDSAREIAVNKVCAIVSRSEPRDFFDLHYLVSQWNQDPDQALLLAKTKDGGVDAEALVMILGSIRWPDFQIPGLEVTAAADFFQDWYRRLAVGLFPSDKA